MLNSILKLIWRTKNPNTKEVFETGPYTRPPVFASTISVHRVVREVSRDGTSVWQRTDPTRALPHSLFTLPSHRSPSCFSHPHSFTTDRRGMLTKLPKEGKEGDTGGRSVGALACAACSLVLLVVTLVWISWRPVLPPSTSGALGRIPLARKSGSIGVEGVHLGRRQPAVARGSVRVLAEFPHDPNSFTQGLEFHKGVLYEATGLRGHSKVRKVDLATGEVLKEVSLENTFFGEGLTVFNERLYVLTWQSHVGLIFDLELNEVGRWKFPTEGWGIAHTDTAIVYSDGTDRLFWSDTPDATEGGIEKVRTMNVVDGETGSPVRRINELEFFGGLLWANLWKESEVVAIDPETGVVVARLDAAGVVERSGERPGAEKCLNGIAFNEADGKLYLTGKKWNKVFEVDKADFDQAAKAGRRDKG